MKSDKWIDHALFGHLGAVEQVTFLEWNSCFLKKNVFAHLVIYHSFFSGLLVKHSLFSALLRKLIPFGCPVSVPLWQREKAISLSVNMESCFTQINKCVQMQQQPANPLKTATTTGALPASRPPPPPYNSSQLSCTADLTMSNNNVGRNNVPDLKQASGGADTPGQCFYTRSPTVVMHTAHNCGQAAMLVIFNYIH